MILAISLATIKPALGHGDHSPGTADAPFVRGACLVQVSGQNMPRIEKMFRSMPQATRMNLQHVMRHAGLYEGRDDGIWGPRTSCAIKAVAARFDGPMTDRDLVAFYEYLLDGGFVSEYPGTPSDRPHRDVLY